MGSAVAMAAAPGLLPPPPFAYFEAAWRRRTPASSVPPPLPPFALARLARSPALQNLARSALFHRAALGALALGPAAALEAVDAVEDAAAALRAALRL